MTTAVSVGVIEVSKVSDKKWPVLEMGEEMGDLHSRDTDYYDWLKYELECKWATEGEGDKVDMSDMYSPAVIDEMNPLTIYEFYMTEPMWEITDSFVEGWNKMVGVDEGVSRKELERRVKMFSKGYSESYKQKHRHDIGEDELGQVLGEMHSLPWDPDFCPKGGKQVAVENDAEEDKGLKIEETSALHISTGLSQIYRSVEKKWDDGELKEPILKYVGKKGRGKDFLWGMKLNTMEPSKRQRYGVGLDIPNTLEEGYVLCVDGNRGKTTFAVTLARLCMTNRNHMVFPAHGIWWRDSEYPRGMRKESLVNNLDDYLKRVQELGDVRDVTERIEELYRETIPGSTAGELWGKIEKGMPHLFKYVNIPANHLIIFDDIDEWTRGGRKITDACYRALKLAKGYGITTIFTVDSFDAVSPKIQQIIDHRYQCGEEVYTQQPTWVDYEPQMLWKGWERTYRDLETDPTKQRRRYYGVTGWDVKVKRDGKIEVVHQCGSLDFRKKGSQDEPTLCGFFEIRDDPAFQYLQKKKSDLVDAILQEGEEGSASISEAERKGRNEIIKKVVSSGEVTQKDLSEMVGMHASQISRIVNDE